MSSSYFARNVSMSPMAERSHASGRVANVQCYDTVMETPRRAEHIAFGLAVCGAVGGLVFAVARTHFVPLGDVLHTVLGAVARAHIDDPALGFGKFVTANAP